MIQSLIVLNPGDTYKFRNQLIPDFYDVTDSFCHGDGRLQ